MSRTRTHLALLVMLGWWTLAPGTALPESESVHVSGAQGQPVTVIVRDAPVNEVFEMLAREQQVNILLGEGVKGQVSVNLFQVSLDHAIRAIADAAGYVAERRRGGFMIIRKDQLGRDAVHDNTTVRTFKVQYSDPAVISGILEKHLSRYGQITVLPERRLLVVEDQPDFVARLDGLLEEIDRQPHQILIDAKILEITLDEDEVFGIDWSHVFDSGDGTGIVGVRGLADPFTPGLFFDLVRPEIEVALNALSEKGRVRTLSTPTLLALEHEEAEVVIGDRLGFRVTTTINEVTTESVEFLESGVILRFTASVDQLGRVVLEIHPEVSTGVIVDGVPNQNTTEVTTKLLIEDGEKIFIGGLIKDRSTETRTGIPLLSDIPWLGRLFARNERITVAAETVVVATAHVVDEARRRASLERAQRMPIVEEYLQERRQKIERAMDYYRRSGPDAGEEAEPGGGTSRSEAPEPTRPAGTVPEPEPGADGAGAPVPAAQAAEASAPAP